MHYFTSVTSRVNDLKENTARTEGIRITLYLFWVLYLLFNIVIIMKTGYAYIVQSTRNRNKYIMNAIRF